MHTSIKNPIKHAKRSAERNNRRKRPTYPVLSAGDSALPGRDECGITRRFLPVDMKTGESPTKRLMGRFVFKRAINAPSRSRYAPHIGKKQDARLLRTLGLVA